MKLDFTYYNPTKIYFGKAAIGNLSQSCRTTAIRCCWFTAKGLSRKAAFMTK